LLAFACGAPRLSAAKNGGDELQEIYRRNATDSLGYLLHLPAGYDPARSYPLVLCFHGAGGRGQDNKGRGTEAGAVLRSPSSQERYPCFVLLPQCPPNEKWVDTEWGRGSYRLKDVAASKSMTLALEALQAVLARYSVDRQRVYVTGQSMGGFATWDAVLRQPALFAAAVPVCGGGDPTEAARISSLPVWVFHGTDDHTIPVAASREMVAALKTKGSEVRFTELAGVEHNAWSPAWRDEKELLPWLFRQRREPDAPK
jgi:predicted peptidase